MPKRSAAQAHADDPIEDVTESDTGLSELARSQGSAHTLNTAEGLLYDAKIQLRCLWRTNIHKQLVAASDLAALDTLALQNLDEAGQVQWQQYRAATRRDFASAEAEFLRSPAFAQRMAEADERHPRRSAAVLSGAQQSRRGGPACIPGNGEAVPLGRGPLG